MRPALSLACGVLLAAVPSVLSGCGGGGAGGTGSAAGDFVVLSTEPQNNVRIFLNDAIAVDFSGPVDLQTADFNTFQFEVFDVGGRQRASSISDRATPGAVK